MVYNFKKNKINGDRAENEFYALCMKNKKDITKSNEYDDKYKHIDFYVKLKNKIESIDIKAIKRVFNEYNNDLYYIEMINDYGYKGWIFSAKLDLIGFENIESFNIYNREDLLNFIQNSKKKYKQIKRKLKFSENYSLCFLIPKADIEHLKYYQLIKSD